MVVEVIVVGAKRNLARKDLNVAVLEQVVNVSIPLEMDARSRRTVLKEVDV